MSHIVYKKSSISDKFLKKTELKARYIFRKIIQASLNLNSYFGEGKFSRTQLWERVNCYLEKDAHPKVSFNTFRNYLNKLKNLSVQDRKIVLSEGQGLGKDQGAYFIVLTQENALYLVNRFFYIQKVGRQREQKVGRQRERKVGRQLVYMKSQLKSSVSKEQTKIPVYEEPIKESEERQTSSQESTSQPQKSKGFSPTQQISSSSFFQPSRSSLGTQAYKQALRDLETMRIGQTPLKEIERTLNHPIARENATLNLRDFLRDLIEEKRQSGIDLYLQELKALNGSMRLMKKGSEKYNTLLEETLNPKLKPATRRHSGVLLPSEQNARFGIKPASQEEIEAIWKDFYQRKQRFLLIV